MKKAEKFKLTFLKKEQLNNKTFTFYFSRPKDFQFNPGQYIKIFLDIPDSDSRGTTRYFTVSSSPLEKEFIAITTRIIKSSFKLKLSSLNPGERINVFGPLGYFDFNIKDKNQHVFLAGGIGITPFHSVLKYINSKKINSKITLIVSFSSEEEIIFYDELKKIEFNNSNVKIIYTLTSGVKKMFQKGRIDEDKIMKYVSGFKNAKYFVVGSEAFEFSVYKMLINIGVKEEKIFKENFPGY